MNGPRCGCGPDDMCEQCVDWPWESDLGGPVQPPTPEQVHRLMIAIDPNWYEKLMQGIVDWGYDTKRYEADNNVTSDLLPDTTGLRAKIGDLADDLRVRSIRRRAERTYRL